MHPLALPVPTRLGPSSASGRSRNDRASVVSVLVKGPRRAGHQRRATSWGWIHLLVGLVVAVAGLAVLGGRTWGRVVGITLAMLSALANFLFIPYYPFWALTVIVLDIFIIWALAAHGRDVAA